MANLETSMSMTHTIQTSAVSLVDQANGRVHGIKFNTVYLLNLHMRDYPRLFLYFSLQVKAGFEFRLNVTDDELAD